MPNWNDVLTELNGNNKGPHDNLRLKYLQALHKITGRNVLVYYSGWLHKNVAGGSPADMSISDSDKTGFMSCTAGMDRSLGLDLILHTPGGDVAATESLIDYLHDLYDGNIRAIIPQLAMSGGTLMAVSCKEIVMGRQSSLGPVDPQIGGVPAQGVLEEFRKAEEDIKVNPQNINLWQLIIGKYQPTFIGSCKHAIDWSDELLRNYLANCMFLGEDKVTLEPKIDRIANALGKQSESKNHNRHINHRAASDLGLTITPLEGSQELQNAVLSLHHALTITFEQTAATKIIENQLGIAYVKQLKS